MGHAYGTRELDFGCEGADVAELQLRLAGFKGTVPDGRFGEASREQVKAFQADVMGIFAASGKVDADTFHAIDRFAGEHPFDFKQLACRCGRCPGFGNGLQRGVYAPPSGLEKHHRYEYPGVHRMLLWAVRGLFHYMPDHRFRVSSGYRCGHDNVLHGRTTTNHHGKAIDVEVWLDGSHGNAKECDAARHMLVLTANAQIGWNQRNRKALEPPSLAPTWVHYDVRTFDPEYLRDEFFCRTLEELDGI
ncbi:MAG: peptidoglycan-binding domain-containing protein [Ramlibacter sp.]